MRTVIIAIFIMIILAAVLLVLPFAIMFFSYIFGIEINEHGDLMECIGCHVNDKTICEHNCSFMKRIRRKKEREERRKRRNETKRNRGNKRQDNRNNR